MKRGKRGRSPQTLTYRYYIQWTSQTFIQLTALSILAVGQSILGRHAELQADEQFRTTMSTYHDIEEIMNHLSAQDAELLRQKHMLIHLLEKNGISLEQLEAEGVTGGDVMEPFSQPRTTDDATATPVPTENEERDA